MSEHFEALPGNGACQRKTVPDEFFESRQREMGTP